MRNTFGRRRSLVALLGLGLARQELRPSPPSLRGIGTETCAAPAACGTRQRAGYGRPRSETIGEEGAILAVLVFQ